MLAPSHERLFEAVLQTYHPSKALGALIQLYLEGATHETENRMGTCSPPTPHRVSPLSPDSANLLDELGEYFTRTAVMLSSIAQNLIQGPHIDRATSDALERSKQETLFWDLSVVAAVDVEISRLREIRDLTVRFSDDVQAVWNSEGLEPGGSSGGQTSTSDFMNRRAPPPPSLAIERNTQTIQRRWSSSEIVTGEHTLQVMEVSEPEGCDQYDDDDDDEDDVVDEEELFEANDMEALKKRGKGLHYCPKGDKCDKGGVDKDGHLIQFDRNSSFLYVIKVDAMDKPPEVVCISKM